MKVYLIFLPILPTVNDVHGLHLHGWFVLFLKQWYIYCTLWELGLALENTVHYWLRPFLELGKPHFVVASESTHFPSACHALSRQIYKMDRLRQHCLAYWIDLGYIKKIGWNKVFEQFYELNLKTVNVECDSV